MVEPSFVRGCSYNIGGGAGKHGRTPLHLAARDGDLPALRALTRQGADLDEVDCLLLWGLALGVQDHPEVVVLLQEGLVLRPERVPQ